MKRGFHLSILLIFFIFKNTHVRATEPSQEPEDIGWFERFYMSTTWKRLEELKKEGVLDLDLEYRIRDNFTRLKLQYEKIIKEKEKYNKALEKQREDKEKICKDFENFLLEQDEISENVELQNMIENQKNDLYGFFEKVQRDSKYFGDLQPKKNLFIRYLGFLSSPPVIKKDRFESSLIAFKKDFYDINKQHNDLLSNHRKAKPFVAKKETFDSFCQDLKEHLEPLEKIPEDIQLRIHKNNEKNTKVSESEKQNRNGGIGTLESSYMTATLKKIKEIKEENTPHKLDIDPKYRIRDNFNRSDDQISQELKELEKIYDETNKVKKEIDTCMGAIETWKPWRKGIKTENIREKCPWFKNVPIIPYSHEKVSILERDDIFSIKESELDEIFLIYYKNVDLSRKAKEKLRATQKIQNCIFGLEELLRDPEKKGIYERNNIKQYCPDWWEDKEKTY